MMQADKSLGQHWLVDIASLEHIVEFANLNENDFVLEIGPGHGALTQYLVNSSEKVLAIEFDKNLADSLKSKIKATNLEVINEDILKFDYSDLPRNYKIVANIPYYLTSNLIRRIVESDNLPHTIVFLIQKEVAQRLAAQKGDMSLLALSAQMYFNVELGEVVGKDCFDPPPKVDSQVVKLNRLSSPEIPAKNIDSIFRLAKIAYSSKRKTLLNTISGGLNVDKADLTSIQQKYKDVDFSLRPQNLGLSDWSRLVEVLDKEGLL